MPIVNRRHPSNSAYWGEIISLNTEETKILKNAVSGTSEINFTKPFELEGQNLYVSSDTDSYIHLEKDGIKMSGGSGAVEVEGDLTVEGSIVHSGNKISFPDKSGTVALTSDLASENYATNADIDSLFE